jgi:hypothetical protein
MFSAHKRNLSEEVQVAKDNFRDDEDHASDQPSSSINDSKPPIVITHIDAKGIEQEHQQLGDDVRSMHFDDNEAKHDDSNEEDDDYVHEEQVQSPPCTFTQ